MSDILTIRLAKVAQAEYEDGEVDWNEISEEDQERWQRAALKVYQLGVADALKDPGTA